MKSVTVTLTATSEKAVITAGEERTAFFKAYTALSPLVKKAKSEEAIAALKEIAEKMQSLAALLDKGKKKD